MKSKILKIVIVSAILLVMFYFTSDFAYNSFVINQKDPTLSYFDLNIEESDGEKQIEFNLENDFEESEKENISKNSNKTDIGCDGSCKEYKKYSIILILLIFSFIILIGIIIFIILKLSKKSKNSYTPDNTESSEEFNQEQYNIPY